MDQLISKENYPKKREYLNRIRRDLDKAYAKGLVTERQVEVLWARALEKQRERKATPGDLVALA